MNPHSIDSVLDLLADLVAAKVADKIGPASNKAERRLLNITEASSYLDRTKQALYRLNCEGSIPSVRTDHRMFFDVRDLDAWIELNKFNAN
jgi:hypothetical protein